jgi:cell fate (sporulation/competence/biofilm development) regulator YlbF (YheA/YmcA/DUF963 family)
MDKIFEAAKELGECLGKHALTQKYLDAKKKADSDPSAKSLINDYEKAAMGIAKKEREGQPIEPSDKHLLSDLQSKIAGNDIIKQWMNAQVEYMNLLRQVNQVVLGEAKLPQEELI